MLPLRGFRRALRQIASADRELKVLDSRTTRLYQLRRTARKSLGFEVRQGVKLNWSERRRKPEVAGSNPVPFLVETFQGSAGRCLFLSSFYSVPLKSSSLRTYGPSRSYPCESPPRCFWEKA